MTFQQPTRLSVIASVLAIASVSGADGRQGQNHLANAEVLIVRHAERQDLQDALTSAGKARARAYATYFATLSVDGRHIHLTHLFAEKSKRTRETLEPLSRALGLPLDTRYSNKEFESLADDLRTHSYGPEILICWHHRSIPSLIDALGGNADVLIPGRQWPIGTYDWLIDLRFDQNGRLKPEDEKLLHEHLMPSDAN